jgi:hypothetical protein
MRRFLRLAPIAFAALACATHPPRAASELDRPPARYLFAWAGDEDRQDSDFLAVVDLARSGDRYGTIVATTPIGEKGIWPHHTEHELSASRMLFANGFAGNRTVLFDLHDPQKPKVVERFNDVGGLTFLHSFARLPNGHVVATFQSHGPNNEGPGGIAEFDESGKVVRSRSAADSTADQTTLRPYSLAVVPALDRVVVALTYMPIPTWHPLRPSIAHDHTGNQVQVYRLSDLALLKTIRLPTNDGPNEPRVLQDGRTVLVSTVACRLYRVDGLDGADPQLELVHGDEKSGCARTGWRPTDHASSSSTSRHRRRSVACGCWTSIARRAGSRSTAPSATRDRRDRGSRSIARAGRTARRGTRCRTAPCSAGRMNRRLRYGAGALPDASDRPAAARSE